MLTRLAHVIVRHRWLVIGLWIVLTALGAFAAGQVSSRWYQSTSIPGQPAYEASQRGNHQSCKRPYVAKMDQKITGSAKPGKEDRDRHGIKDRKTCVRVAGCSALPDMTCMADAKKVSMRKMNVEM